MNLIKMFNLDLLYTPRVCRHDYYKCSNSVWRHAVSLPEGQLVRDSPIKTPPLRGEYSKFVRLGPVGLTHFRERISYLSFMTHVIMRHGIHRKKDLKDFNRLSKIAFTCNYEAFKSFSRHIVKSIWNGCKVRYSQFPTTRQKRYRAIPHCVENKTLLLTEGHTIPQWNLTLPATGVAKTRYKRDKVW